MKISSAYTPPREGFVSPMRWGVESDVLERFGAAGIAEGAIAFERNTFTFAFDGPPSRYVEEFRTWYGPTMNAFEAAAREGRAEALQADLEALRTG